LLHRGADFAKGSRFLPGAGSDDITPLRALGNRVLSRITRISSVHVVTLIDMVAEAGGAETLAAELIERLDPERFRRTLVVYRHLDPSSPLHGGQERVLARLRAEGIEVLQLEGRNRRDLASWRPFLALLRGGSVDILHAHKFGPNAWGAVLSRLAGRAAFIAHEHTWSFEGRPMRRLLDRWLIATRCAAFLAVSDRDRRRMIELERIPASRIRLLENGIPEPEVLDGVDVRTLFGIPHGVPLIGAVGVYRPQKDFCTLLRAFALVRRDHPDARLIVVGDGPQRAELEAARRELGLEEAVIFTGFRNDATTLVAGFDVAVNSSLFEGASLAILEYMALGVPVVATGVGGTPELLEDGAAGLLVPPGDPERLAAGIAAVLDDRARATQLADRACERQRSIYSIDAQVRRLQDIYLDVLGR
jgi:glycosyltransferase involved in cell wall biosynthesis